ncbi:unnamed protein product, partial [Protopolystoma xenopodis]
NARIVEAANNVETSERESRRLVSQAEGRVRELEVELEQEAKKSRDLLANYRKTERIAKETVQAHEEEKRLVVELRDVLDRNQAKMRQLRRQLEEAVSVKNR